MIFESGLIPLPKIEGYRTLIFPKYYLVKIYKKEVKQFLGEIRLPQFFLRRGKFVISPNS
jgi:hypothetical protein